MSGTGLAPSRSGSSPTSQPSGITFADQYNISEVIFKGPIVMCLFVFGFSGELSLFITLYLTIITPMSISTSIQFRLLYSFVQIRNHSLGL